MENNENNDNYNNIDNALKLPLITYEQAIKGFFSYDTNLYYKLIPTKTLPSLNISGIHMHRIKDIDPKTDTEIKVRGILKYLNHLNLNKRNRKKKHRNRIEKIALDTCCGLGYTAILLSKYFDKVITVEKDPNVLAIAKVSPYSKKLFKKKNITIILDDVFNFVNELDNECFDAVLHDPPRLSRAVNLYSKNFYEQLYRIMKIGAVLYHYTGSPGSKYRKVKLRDNIIRKLRNVGFSRVIKYDEGLGLIAIK